MNWRLYLLCRKTETIMMEAANRTAGTTIIGRVTLLVSISSIVLENITFPTVLEKFPMLTYKYITRLLGSRI